MQFFAFACLGDPDCAEAGVVPLDECGGFGLRDLAAQGIDVELDRVYTPEPVSVVWRRIKGYPL